MMLGYHSFIGANLVFALYFFSSCEIMVVDVKE